MLKTNEKGFTLIEMLVTILILSTVLTAATAAVIVTMKTTTQNTELHVNLRQVQNAGNWISRDALMAQEIHIDTPGVFLNLIWSDWHGNSFNVDYVITADHMMMRQVNTEPASLIAEYIVPAETDCVWDDAANKLAVTIEACVHDDNNGYQQTYEIYPRPVAGGG
jgi:prepilin-type N-terminal cleavage/methylation domain-containing protein